MNGSYLFSGGVIGALFAMGVTMRFLATRIRREILRSLGVCRVGDVHVIDGTPLPGFFEHDLQRALRDGLPELGLEVCVRGLRGLLANTAETLPPINIPGLTAGAFLGGWGAVGSETVALGGDRAEAIPSGVLYLSHTASSPLAILVVKTAEPEVWLQAAVPDRPDARAWGQDVVRRLEERALTRSVYRGRAIKPVFRYSEQPTGVEFVEVSSPREIRLDDRVAGELDRELVAFIRHGPTLEDSGVPSQRGILLCGEPGTGKTSTCRYLQERLPDHTFVFVEARAVDHVKAVFALARRLAPAVVVLEDLDLMVQNRDPMLSNVHLREVLNALDGVEGRDGVAVIMTSNSWRFIEDALADRPGRIDHVVFYEAPGPEHRRVLLSAMTGRMPLEVSVDSMVRLTDGLTPAQIREVTKKAAVRALGRRGGAGAGWAVTEDDVRHAVEWLSASSLSKRSRREVGIRPAAIAVRAAG